MKRYGKLDQAEKAVLWRMMAQEMAVAAAGKSRFLSADGIEHLRSEYEVDVPELLRPFREAVIPVALEFSGDDDPPGSVNDDVVFLTLGLTPEFVAIATFGRDPPSLSVMSFQFQ